MKQHANIRTKTDRRVRIPALVLLCLTLHALFICLTHRHDAAPSHTPIIAASDSAAQAAGDAGSDAGCLSCRLQRQFVADPHAGALSIEAVAEALLYQARLAQAEPRRPATSLFGRAPPLV